jgi:hypothetical protein
MAKTTKPAARVIEVAYHVPGKGWKRTERREGRALERLLEKLAEQGCEVRTRAAEVAS